MPNWASCAIDVTEGERFFADLAPHIQNDNDIEDFFSIFVPMPADLEDVRTGRRNVVDHLTLQEVTVDRWRGEGEKATAVPDAQRESWNRLYGADDQLTWARQAWGTKWDTDAHVIGNRILFDTAWSPPEQFVRTLSMLYPEATFTLAYAEGGMAFWGTAIFVGGEVRAGTYCPDDFWLGDVDWDSDEAQRDDDPRYGTTPRCRAHLERYDLGTGG